ncbi:RNA ligase family protein [Cellulosilyticum sp. I15G10I2]|uniref:RNA ligase family protein n=1 Tax=Cellulosilyticum sp. I15G10I2 TaxID=1892843 RepID=UPI00085C12BB|nr:RNA ligase family protein [Cellulosilyticum sp. I15G10I2]
MHSELIKYPRTKHITGSMLQTGDNNLKAVPFKQIMGKYVVLEEKIDGANSGISFSQSGQLLLQSRGHFLTGGHREKHFHLFKTWSSRYSEELYKLLGSRYIMYGEWMYAKHTIFYDQLPHYFMEFDMYDKQEKLFLSTKERGKMLQSYPFIHSVKVLYEGKIEKIDTIRNLIGASYFISEKSIKRLKKACEKQELDFIKVQSETDLSGIMEGIYIKVEDLYKVSERYKYVRESFKTQIVDSETHWLDRPIIENQLENPGSLFE